MGWSDRVDALWEAGSRDFPLKFHRGWIRVESDGDNSERTSRGEVGWYQLDAAERDAVGLSDVAILDDEATSFRAGASLMALNDGKVPTAISGTARLGLIKMWHTLPALARLLGNHFRDGASDWRTMAAWGLANVSAAQIDGHNPAKWIRNVDKVMSEVTEDSLPIAEQAEIVADTIGSIVGTEDSGMIVTVGLVALLGLSALTVLLWRIW